MDKGYCEFNQSHIITPFQYACSAIRQHAMCSNNQPWQLQIGPYGNGYAGSHTLHIASNVKNPSTYSNINAVQSAGK